MKGGHTITELQISSIMNVWQICPKCNGTGTMTVTLPGYVVHTHADCNLCHGKMIISRLNGLPPGDETTDGGVG